MLCLLLQQRRALIFPTVGRFCSCNVAVSVCFLSVLFVLGSRLTISVLLLEL